jgi:hypothetical protein
MSTATPSPAPREPGDDTGAKAGHVTGSQLENLKLQALSFSDKAILDAYTEALKNGLSAAADANGTLITASLAIATLYGTLIGLVSPKNQASPFIVVLPMIPLVGAFLAAVFGKTRGISFEPATTTAGVRSGLADVVNAQRLGIRLAVTLLAIGLIAAGFILADVYGRPKPPPATRTVYLTAEGQRTISSVCHKHVTSITGSVGTSPVAPQDIVIAPTQHSPCDGQMLELAPQEVAAIK